MSKKRKSSEVKANGAPERIYVNSVAIFTALQERRKDSDIEYVRSDVFIEKAMEAFCKATCNVYPPRLVDMFLDMGFNGKESKTLIKRIISIIVDTMEVKEDVFSNIDYVREEVFFKKAREAFCKATCNGHPPRSTCLSLGTCIEYDNFEKYMKYEE